MRRWDVVIGVVASLLAATRAEAACGQPDTYETAGMSCDPSLQVGDQTDRQFSHPRWSSFADEKNPLNDHHYAPPDWGSNPDR